MLYLNAEILLPFFVSKIWSRSLNLFNPLYVNGLTDFVLSFTTKFDQLIGQTMPQQILYWTLRLNLISFSVYPYSLKILYYQIWSIFRQIMTLNPLSLRAL